MWVVNAEGVYIENRPYHSYLENDILTAINEKYGTNFSSLTYLREPSIAIGDDCPDWDAYEKILLPEMVNFRFVPVSGTANLAGFMQGDKAYINSATESSVWNVSPEGQVWGPGGQTSLYEQQAKNLLLSNFGREISEVLPFVVEWQQGSQVPNWESYTLLS